MSTIKFENTANKPNVFDENVENVTELRLLTEETEKSLDDKISQLVEYISTNHGRGKTDEEKDQLYASAKDQWSAYVEVLKNAEFALYLNHEQHKFLVDLVKNKLEYTTSTLFYAIELTKMLGTWTSKENLQINLEETTVTPYYLDATETTYLYHLISEYKVKGLSAASYRFAEVLYKLADINRVVAYYDNCAKTLKKDYENWVASFEDNVTVEGSKFNPIPVETPSTTV